MPLVRVDAGSGGWPRGHRLAAAAVGVALWAATAMGRADLARDAEGMRVGWTQRGLQVGHAGTAFLLEGERLELELPLPSGGAPACQSLVVVAERAIRFDVEAVAASGDGDGIRQVVPDGSREPRAERWAASSRGGIAMLEACRAELPRLRRVRVRMRSSRAALELLVVRHDGPLPPLEMVAPERALGPSAAGPRLGRAQRGRTLLARAERAADAARLDGAEKTLRLVARATPRGMGAVGLQLPAGCHRISLLADDSGISPPAGDRDLDAEVRRQGATVAMRQDRSNATDARLEFCLGEAERVAVRFLGAGGAVDVALVSAVWPLPRAAALTTDAQARGALAWALFRRRLPEVGEPPLLVVRGGPGTTRLPVSLEPGACYLAAMALVRGEAGAARLSAAVGARTVRDQSRTQPPGGAVTFCAAGQVAGRLDVELRSGFGWWLLGLWRLTGGGD